MRNYIGSSLNQDPFGGTFFVKGAVLYFGPIKGP